jgi:hypothetical protein
VVDALELMGDDVAEGFADSGDPHASYTVAGGRLLMADSVAKLFWGPGRAILIRE